ncbi:hypothetical protein DFH07DRAFT_764109 [Mycena maculata]|uniref:Uncharacterized protein n=1 Tax=Mycena maculata TaxID=230809 RepID=A0AAD7KDT8_9AGAR|nr:hypothetical protein DFH07DRAFT_764109 [Mycena maculata]
MHFNPRSMNQKPVHAIPSFPNVHELRAVLGLPTPSQNLIILSKFPAVHILRLLGKPRGRVHKCLLFPPSSPLALFLPVAALTHITIPRCSPQDFIACIQDTQSPNIVSLHMEFTKLDNTAFNTLSELFPRLTELLIRIVVSDMSRWFSCEIYDSSQLKDDEVVDGQFGDSVRAGSKLSKFFIQLANTPTVPPNLEHLAISWECYEKHFDELSAYKIPDFAQLRDTLVVRCTSLTWLWFDGFYFLYEWCDPMPDGSVKEVTAKTFMSAYGMHSQVPDIFNDWDPLLWPVLATV